MPLRVKIAESAREIDDALHLRRRLALSPATTSDPRLIDVHDALPASTIFVAYWDGAPSGTLRVTRDSVAGLPGEKHNNLSAARDRAKESNGESRPLALISHLCTDTSCPAHPLLLRSLLKAAGRHLKTLGIGDVAGLVHPERASHLGNGMERLGDAFALPEFQDTVCLVYGNVASLAFTATAEPELPQGHERGYFRDKDAIFKAGDPCEKLYVVIKGRVDLVAPRQDGPDLAVGTLEAGEIFGQDVLAGNVHSYTALAAGPCEIGVFSRTTLLDYLRSDPARLAAEINHLSLRLKNLTQITAEGAHGRLSGLRLFNDYLVARVVLALSHLDFFTYAAASSGFTAAQAAQALTIPETTLKMLLEYLADMGAIRKSADRYYFEQDVRHRLEKEMGFLEWLISGYEPVLADVENIIAGKASYGKDVRRDDRWMASASAAISRRFTDEHMYTLLHLDDVRIIADVGCGSGLRLVDLMRRMPHLKAVGLDLSPDCCALARENVKAANLADRITVIQGHAEGWIKREGERLRAIGGERKRPVDLVLCFAMFHDLMNHKGMAENFLEDLRLGLGPNAYILIQDQLRLPEQDWGRAPNWVHGFEVIHHFMGQRLFLCEEYEELFARQGFELVEKAATDIPENWIFLLRT